MYDDVLHRNTCYKQTGATQMLPVPGILEEITPLAPRWCRPIATNVVRLMLMLLCYATFVTNDQAEGFHGATAHGLPKAVGSRTYKEEVHLDHLSNYNPPWQKSTRAH